MNKLLGLEDYRFKGKAPNTLKSGKKEKVLKKFTKSFVTFNMKRMRLKDLRKIVISKNSRRMVVGV